MDLQNRMLVDWRNKYSVDSIYSRLITYAESELSGGRIPQNSLLLLQYKAVAGLLNELAAQFDTDLRGSLDPEQAEGVGLDYLGRIVGAVRRQPSAATAVFNINWETVPLADGAADITVYRSGDKVDGEPDFSGRITARAGEPSTIVTLTATVEGQRGNGFAIGTLNTVTELNVVTEIPKFTIQNITVTSGGNDYDDDVAMLQNIFYAQGDKAIGGTVYQYKAQINAALQNVAGMQVYSPPPPENIVELYFILRGGILPNERDLLTVNNCVQDPIRRLQNEKIYVYAPTYYDVTLDVSYYVERENALNLSQVKADVLLAVQSWVNDESVNIGGFIDIDDLTARMRQVGAKNISVASPVPQRLNKGRVLHCTNDIDDTSIKFVDFV